MIKKEKAKKLGIKIQEQNDTMEGRNTKLIEKLKSLLPNIINSDGTLNTEALQDAIDISHTTSNNQGYELTFAGKWVARWMAGTLTKKELKTEKEQSKNFEKTRNILIRGDNLDVLKILYQNYHNKIKMIYIDPPYNTQSDEFIYKDNFKKSEQELIEECGIEEEEIDFLQNIYGTKTHSGWLAFMYPRLKLARDLLREDGVIFISIDDNEQANLKIICDETFGEDNFVASLIWKTKQAARGVPPTTMIMSNHEHIICYSQNKGKFKFLGIERDKDDFENPDNDKRGLWRSESISATGSQNNIFTIKDPNTGNKFTKNWAFSEQKIKEMINNNLILFPKSIDGTPRQKKFYNSYKNDFKAFVSDLGWFSTENSTKQLMNIFQNKKIFNFPKPIDLIKFLVNQSSPKPILFLKNTTKVSTNPNNNDLILDFFAGSGTTGDAVMQLNAEDGGNRKFILVQWDEKINPKKNKEAHDFCKDNNLQPVISSICLERLNRAGEKIKRENQTKRGMFPSSEGLDIGYKVFSLKKKPQIEDEELVIQNERQSTLDTLFNMLSTTGKTLDTPIQEIQKDVLYECDGEIYLIAKTNPERLENYRNHKVNIDGYAEIDLESFLNMQVATRENLNIIY